MVFDNVMGDHCVGEVLPARGCLVDSKYCDEKIDLLCIPYYCFCDSGNKEVAIFALILQFKSPIFDVFDIQYFRNYF